MTTPKIDTTHRATQELGPSVIENRLIWTSASGVTKGDTNSTGGCLRAWWYEQVMGKRSPSTKAQERGTALHDEIDGHLTEGKPLMSPLAISGREFINERGPGILVEQPLHVSADGRITGAWLYAGDVPFAGHVDLWNHRGIYINSEGELIVEPRPNTLETKDWKTTSDFKYAKSAAELADNVQLVTYAEAGFRMWPHLEHARLTHVYFRTRGAAQSRLVTVLRDREQIGRRWEYVETLVRTLADVARETQADKVPGNRFACGAYAGCPHASYCSVGSFDSLADVFGPRGVQELDARFHGTPLPQVTEYALQGPGSKTSPLAQLLSRETPGKEPASLAQAIWAPSLLGSPIPPSVLCAERGHDTREGQSEPSSGPEPLATLPIQGHYDRSLSSDVGSTEWPLRDLPSSVQRNQRLRDRPQSHDQECARTPMQAMQLHAGERARESKNALSSDPVPGKESEVSLIDKFSPEVLAAAQAGMAVPSAPAPSMIAPPPTVQTMPAAAGVGVQVSMAQAVDAEAQRLAAEETTRRAQAAAGIPPGFAQAVAAIEAANRGAPAYVGRAAQAIANLKGFVLQPGMMISGGGWLGERVKSAIEDPALILQLAAEVSSLPPLPVEPPAPVAPPPAPPAPAAPMLAGVMPPDAPASNPALAAQPVEGFDNAKARELATLTTPVIPGLTDTAASVAATGHLPAPAAVMMTPGAPIAVTGIAAAPPGTVVTMTAQPGTYVATPPQAPMMTAAPAVGAVPPQSAAPAPAAVPPQQPTETAAAPAAPTRKAGPGRPRGPRKKKTTTTESVGDVSRTVEIEESDDTSINIYVNCIPSGGFDRLEPYIEQLERALAAQYGASDIRCAPKDGPLGYDKFIGAIAAFARHTPPGPGRWVVKNVQNRMVDAVIEALRTKVEESGGEIVESVWL